MIIERVKQITSKLIFVTLSLIFALASFGCMQQEMVGGPCEYRSEQVAAVVDKLQDEYVLMMHEEDDFVYVVDYGLFDGKPTLGDRYMLAIEVITSGTCTPYVVQSATKS
ncbi:MULTISPECIES: hypothetical protein [Corallincola]|uniref:DUF4377 domain-containing protein n=2 Tax=Corallincola TaxID=1775176 RepID=A0ABY1WUH6_9GAMM|nr:MULTISPECIES: hypothetical protein [Corallincola]TAA48332.1 hypothetical protein EXY25_03630 [Corallincola spongiicola]TCI02368.1 hypothetical protein EZV61_13475 [Corallincola luteus]